MKQCGGYLFKSNVYVVLLLLCKLALIGYVISQLSHFGPKIITFQYSIMVDWFSEQEPGLVEKHPGLEPTDSIPLFQFLFINLIATLVIVLLIIKNRFFALIYLCRNGCKSALLKELDSIKGIFICLGANLEGYEYRVYKRILDSRKIRYFDKNGDFIIKAIAFSDIHKHEDLEESNPCNTCQQLECAICLTNFKSDDIVIPLKCHIHHVYHKTCME